MNSIDKLCVNTLRMLSVDGVEKARSGHPGMPMGCAPMLYVLWSRFLRHNPANPGWPGRDRFVLSAGHGSILLYSLLHLTGYDVSLEELKKFRQWGSRTPGHPEFGDTPGVEATTGPLGQGIANAVGMAMAERILAAHFNRPAGILVDHFTYALTSDGDLMEGISHEAASLAGHLGLGKLIVFYDDNRISIEGSTDLAYSENRAARFEAYGWHVQQVADGNDLQGLEAAIRNARDDTRRPSLIVVRTHIGYGSPNKQDTAGVHGEPLGEKETALTKQNLGWPSTPAFLIPEEALRHFRSALENGRHLEQRWRQMWRDYADKFPDLAREWETWLSGELPAGWDAAAPVFEPDDVGMATRVASGKVLNAFAKTVPNLIGGSADLAPSTKTLIDDAEDFQADRPQGRNLRFGVREHAMGAILNGMALHRGLRPYGATFLVFSDYMRPAIRLAALSKLHVVYVFTHDSIGLGEDGPTHQPIEHLANLRAMPNLLVIRPCDAVETAAAWKIALKHRDGPVALILTRQSLPILPVSDPGGRDAGVHRGAYVIREAGTQPEAVLIASGSEIQLVVTAAELLAKHSVATQVISMPSWELFEAQPAEYRQAVIPPRVPVKVAVEAGATQGWHRYVGERGVVIGLDHFGASAPYQQLYDHFGLTADRIVETVLQRLQSEPSDRPGPSVGE
jgi:transketolase